MVSSIVPIVRLVLSSLGTLSVDVPRTRDREETEMVGVRCRGRSVTVELLLPDFSTDTISVTEIRGPTGTLGAEIGDTTMSESTPSVQSSRPSRTTGKG